MTRALSNATLAQVRARDRRDLPRLRGDQSGAEVALSLRRAFNANELAAAQAELIQREHLAALGEMSAVVAHEVRNPVAIIFKAAASMPRNGDQRDELLSIVEEGASRLEQMVTDLLEFARPSSMHLVDEPLSPIIQGALASVRQASGDLTSAASADIELTLAGDLRSCVATCGCSAPRSRISCRTRSNHPRASATA